MHMNAAAPRGLVRALIGYHGDDHRGLARALQTGLQRGRFPHLLDALDARWRLLRTRRTIRDAQEYTSGERQARAAEWSFSLEVFSVGLSILKLLT